MTTPRFLGNVADDARCQARARHSGERCKNPRAHGTRVCRTHGAGSLASKAKAARRRMQETYENEASQYVRNAERDGASVAPLPLFRQEIARSQAMVEFLDSKLAELDGQTVVGVDAAELRKAGVRARDMASLIRFLSASPHPLYAMFQRERQHLTSLLSISITHGVDEYDRTVRGRLDVQKLDSMQRALDAVVRKLGHDPTDPKVRERVKDALRAV